MKSEQYPLLNIGKSQLPRAIQVAVALLSNVEEVVTPDKGSNK